MRKRSALQVIIRLSLDGRLPPILLSDPKPIAIPERFDNDMLLALQDHVLSESLPPIAQWTEEHYERAALMIKTAENDLTQLKEIAAKFKSSLETYFSLKDVLPDLPRADSHRFP